MDNAAKHGPKPLNRPQVARAAGPGNGWGPRVRSPGPVAFEDMDTKHRAKGVGAGKSRSMGTVWLAGGRKGFEQEEWLPAGGWSHMWVDCPGLSVCTH